MDVIYDMILIHCILIPVDIIYMIYDMILIHCNCFSTRWQWSVDLCKNRKETAMYRRRNNTQKIQKHRYTK